MAYSMSVLKAIHGCELAHSEATVSMALTPWAKHDSGLPAAPTISPPDDEGPEVMVISPEVENPLRGIDIVVDSDD